MKKRKKFNGLAKFHEISGNTGEAFEEDREGHYGGYDASYLVGHSEYGTELEAAAKKAGIVPDTPFAAKTLKIFANGHIKELEVAETGTAFMEIDSGFTIVLQPMGNFAWSNEEWEDARAHLDFIMKIIKGKLELNPEWYLGSNKPNWIIVPDEEDHMYVVDSKTCQDEFSPAWDQRNDLKVKIGGLKNGVCPIAYYDQMQFYCTVCNIDGAVIMASIGNNKVDDYAQVYVPYDPEYGQHLLDTCQKVFDQIKAGKLPKVEDCADRVAAAEYLDKLYYKVNEKKALAKLKNSKWEDRFEQVRELDEEIDRIKASVEKEKELVNKAETQIRNLSRQRRAILLEPIEDIKDRKGYYYSDEYGNTHIVRFEQEMVWDYVTKQFFRKNAPEVYAEAEKLFSKRKTIHDCHSAVKSYTDEEDVGEE